MDTIQGLHETKWNLKPPEKSFMAPHVLLLNILFLLMNGDEISICNFPFMFQDLDRLLLPNQDFIGFFGGKVFQAWILKEFLVTTCLHWWEPQIDSPTCVILLMVQKSQTTTWDVPKTL